MRSIVSIVLLGLGFGLGWYTHVGEPSSFIENVREESSNYKFINPLLFTRVPEDIAFPEYSSLKKDISDYVDRVIKDGRATDVSVYFRNLDSSQWVYINPDRIFTPASMLKVVVLIATLRAAESDPKLMSKTVTLAGTDSLLTSVQNDYHPPKNAVRIGGTYTIQALVNQLIIESDNVASAALVKEIGEDRIFKTYKDLQLHRPSADESGYTAKEYSYLFRALYNGTYLSRSVSEQVLGLLSKTSYDEGIVKLLPQGTVVSHKFGVSATSGGDIERQLHDCGIVYYPEKPYFICIMTKGLAFSDLESVIQNISKIAWDDVYKLDK